MCSISWVGLEMGERGVFESWDLSLTVLCSSFRQMTLLPTYVMLLTSSFSPSLNGPSVFPTSLTSPWRTRSFCFGQVKHIGCLFPWDSFEIAPRILKKSNLMELQHVQAMYHVDDEITLCRFVHSQMKHC